MQLGWLKRRNLKERIRILSRSHLHPSSSSLQLFRRSQVDDAICVCPRHGWRDEEDDKAPIEDILP